MLVGEGGGERERQIVDKRFEALLAHDWVRIYANFKFQVFEDIFRSRVPDTLQWVLRFMYGYNQKAGTDADILADAGEQLNKGQTELVLLCSSSFCSLLCS